MRFASASSLDLLAECLRGAASRARRVESGELADPDPRLIAVVQKTGAAPQFAVATSEVGSRLRAVLDRVTGTASVRRLAPQMTASSTDLHQVSGVEIDLDHVRIPHRNVQKYDLLGTSVSPLAGALPVIFWASGAISTWQMILLVVIGLGFIAGFSPRSFLVLRPALLAQEVRFGRYVWSTRSIPLQTIRRVEVLDPHQFNISLGSLMLHLTGGDEVRIYPCTDPRDSRILGAWLSEVVGRLETVELGEDPVPVELRELPRRDKTRE